jgi:hypothetical protein
MCRIASVKINALFYVKWDNFYIELAITGKGRL